MWSSRDVSYGGLRKRYREFHGGVLRCMDPLRAIPVEFATELKYENWILHWADPFIRVIEPRCPWIECTHNEQRIRVRPDLAITRERTELQLVLSRRTVNAERRISALIAVAQAHDYDWSIRTRDDVRHCPVQLMNLKRLRQCAVLLADRMNVSDLALVSTLLPRAQVLTRREIAGCVPSRFAADLLDTLLIHLHWRGRVTIDLTGGVYGDHTNVQCR